MIASVVATLVGCAPFPSERQEVQGTIASSSGSAVGLCHLAVSTVAGEPVGETAQVVEEGHRFSWPLPPGSYLLAATCETTQGEIQIQVPDDKNDDLTLVVS